jgi:hypothetical protein
MPEHANASASALDENLAVLLDEATEVNENPEQLACRVFVPF